MTTDLNDILDELSLQRQAKVIALAERKIQETLAAASALPNFLKTDTESPY